MSGGSGPRRLELPPERLAGWLAGFAERHGEVRSTDEPDRVRLAAADGAVAEVEVPFPPLPAGVPLVEHALVERPVGLLLVRRGGFAAGVAAAGRLVSGRTGTRHVQGRTAAGGWSQQRFARRREAQAAALTDAAVRLAVEEVVPHASRLAGVLTGGDRLLLRHVLTAAPLAPLAPLVLDRVLDVADPRRAVLVAAAERASRVVVRVHDPA
ncbi:MAG TPA: acVLRF1 family peptidyl-tRNA hydrolase [Jiangellales bacterium]|nr:acVLRF1 family peptidyl-tRNA hydrolase [Jiangellales bacterium]